MHHAHPHTMCRAIMPIQRVNRAILHPTKVSYPMLELNYDVNPSLTEVTYIQRGSSAYIPSGHLYPQAVNSHFSPTHSG